MHSLLLALYIVIGIFIFNFALVAFLLGLSAMGIPRASFFARIIASYICLVICAVYGILASLVLRPLGRHRIVQYLTARSFKLTMYLFAGVRFEIVSGKEYLKAQRPCVIVGNHQSELDVLLLGAIFPPWTSVTAKSSLKWVPFLGWFMALSGTVFIDRGNRADALKAFKGAADEMRRERQNVFIFPEGTRSYANGPELGPFKKGAFHLAVQAGVDIVPVVAGNYSGVLNVEGKRFRTGIIPVVGQSTTFHMILVTFSFFPELHFNDIHLKPRTSCHYFLTKHGNSPSPHPHEIPNSRRRRRPHPKHSRRDAQRPH